MADIPDDHMHVATAAATKVVNTYGLASFLPTGFLQVLIQSILQALLTHQAGQQAVADVPKGKKSKADED